VAGLPFDTGAALRFARQAQFHRFIRPDTWPGSRRLACAWAR
jgi:hypothetical protein